MSSNVANKDPRLAELAKELTDVTFELASHDGDASSGKYSVEHCRLQLRFAQLTQAIAVLEGNQVASMKASELAETWQKRLGEILKAANIDTKRELLRRLEERKKAASKLAGLAEVDEESSDQSLH